MFPDNQSGSWVARSVETPANVALGSYNNNNSSNKTSVLPPAPPPSPRRKNQNFPTNQPTTSPPASPSRKKPKKKRKLGKDLSAKEKDDLLAQLDAHHPVVTNNDGTGDKGKPPSAAKLYKSAPMPPSTEKSWSSEACFDNAAFFLVRDGWLGEHDLASLAKLDPEYEAMVESVPILKRVDFSSLTEERLGFADQTEISHERVIQLTACAVHYGLDFGRVVRYLNNEYTGMHRDLPKLESEIGPHIDPDDMNHIRRILSSGCPAQLKYELPREHKMRMLRRGNQKSLMENMDEVKATMNKEEKHSHVVPFMSFVCRFCNTAQSVPQGMSIKAGSISRLVWDGSTLIYADDIVMNDIIDTDLEAPITFGRTKQDFCQHLYNTRVSHPDEDIDLATADVKSAHRYPRIQPDLAAAFGFIIRGMYFFIATAMVFGAKVSATSWEPFRRAIEVMTRVYSLRTDLVQKHKAYLDMIELEPPAAKGTKFTRALPCNINKGVLDENGNQMPIPNFMYVDDCLLACIRRYTLGFLAGCIEAIFVVLGNPNTKLRPCPLALDKWAGMIVGHRATLIGLTFNSRLLRIGITQEYILQVLQILDTEWPKGFRNFTLDSIVTLAGKLARLGEAAPWVFHLMTFIYSSITNALRCNEKFLLKKDFRYQSFISSIKQLRRQPRAEENVKHLNFLIGKAARMKFKSSTRFNSNRSLNEEIELLRSWLDPASNISWDSPIHHIIKRSPFAVAAGDSCLFGGGGFSTKLRFFWHLTWPEWVRKRTKLYLPNNKKGDLISINVLEFIAIIINYVATLTVLQLEPHVTEDPYPVLLNLADNTSAIRWTNHACKDSLAGRALGRLFCMLLVNSDLGINAEWLSTTENVIADEISRLKNANKDTFFDYSTLKQKFPQLATCRAFQPSRELLSLIWLCVREQKSPSLEQIQNLKLKGLGKLIS